MILDVDWKDNIIVGKIVFSLGICDGSVALVDADGSLLNRKIIHNKAVVQVKLKPTARQSK